MLPVSLYGCVFSLPSHLTRHNKDIQCNKGQGQSEATICLSLSLSLSISLSFFLSLVSSLILPFMCPPHMSLARLPLVFWWSSETEKQRERERERERVEEWLQSVARCKQ